MSPSAGERILSQHACRRQYHLLILSGRSAARSHGDDDLAVDRHGDSTLQRAALSGMYWVVPSIMVEMVRPLVLASQSPRRRELLEVLGVPFSVVVPGTDETPRAGELPEDYVVRVAREKATDAASRVSGSVVLSADTVVTIDGEILGKPIDRADAVRMLTKLSGREHLVYTAVCIIDQPAGRMREGIESTVVWFKPLTTAEIQDYVDRENVMDKAGAYAIQGFASVFIPRISGSYSNVIGLPLALVYQLLSTA